ncbi:MAG: hypothetical protein IKU73_04120 [Clostridia bacterium]|nr:hypothetical protein [Clostridia bacterium]
MKRKHVRLAGLGADVVFLPALTPMEAAVLPAQERAPVRRGALHLAKDAKNWSRVLGCGGRDDQRQKIWVR